MTSHSLIPSFGKLPNGTSLERIKTSPQYKEGKFQNTLPTPMISEPGARWSTLKDYLFESNTQTRPIHDLPMLNVDFKSLDIKQNIVIWLGHSSFYMHLNGKRILIDPVLSNQASPVSFIAHGFESHYPYRADDMPDIDILLISHDHWDHLDYPTIQALKSRIHQAIVPLGIGETLRYWGVAPDAIYELDWHDTLQLANDMTIYALPARHFSGRGLQSNRTLWASYLIETPTLKVFYSGDSGYGPHFADIGKQFGEIDLAIMENGQYDRRWAYIHMTPEEVAQASGELHAKFVIPAHAGRFSLALHAWDDPFKRLMKASQKHPFTLLTPKMGEIADISNPKHTFSPWWEDIQS